MSGPIVRTGATPEFSEGWDRIFGNGKSGKSAAGKKSPAKKKKAAKKKPAKAAAGRKKTSKR